MPAYPLIWSTFYIPEPSQRIGCKVPSSAQGGMMAKPSIGIPGGGSPAGGMPGCMGMDPAPGSAPGSAPGGPPGKGACSQE